MTELETTGRGISAPLSLLEVLSGFNVRENTQPDDEFLASVKTHGILRPLHVRNNPERPGYYFIVDGERRYNAAIKAKLTAVPVIPEGDMGDEEALVMSLVANEGAKHLSPKEEALAFQRLKDAGVPVDEIARVMGRSKRKVDETLRALSSGEEGLVAGVTTDIPEEKIPPRAAARAAALPAEKRKEVARKIKGKNVQEGISIVQAVEKEEGIVKRGRKPKEYPWAKNAKGLAELLEKAAKSIIRAGDPGNRRAEHHLEVIEVLKGKKEPGDLYISILESKKKEETKMTKTTKKATKKKAAKKKAAKKKATKTPRGKKATKKTRGRKPKAAQTEDSSQSRIVVKRGRKPKVTAAA